MRAWRHKEYNDMFWKLQRFDMVDQSAKQLDTLEKNVGRWRKNTQNMIKVFHIGKWKIKCELEKKRHVLAKMLEMNWGWKHLEEVYTFRVYYNRPRKNGIEAEELEMYMY